MKRRDVLAATVVGIAGGAGCTAPTRPGDRRTPRRTPAGSDGTADGSPAPPAPFAHAGTVDGPLATNGDFPTDRDPADGLPPAFPDPPDAPDVDGSSFETRDVNGEAVPLAPIDVVEAWYRRSAARFVDARGLPQYRASHVYGSVMSTARIDSTGGAIEGWPTDDRIVTYCGCPHHLSVLRGAGLLKAGHSHVYALDEGYAEWSNRDYPMAGTRFAPERDAEETTWTVQGRLDRAHAGEYVLATVAGQYEAAPIGPDGRFVLELRLVSVTGGTPVRLVTPAGSVTRPLGELASDGFRSA